MSDLRDAVARTRDEVCALHAELPRNGLVAWTSGNVSGRVPGTDLFVIKPSGLDYDALTPESMVLCAAVGSVLDGVHSPSSDTASHAYVYRHRPDVGGVVHTPSTYATAWSARGEAIPCVITAMADEFGGEIPVGPFALIGGEDIGRVVVETLAGHRCPAVLMRNHGVFTVGRDARHGRQGGRYDGRTSPWATGSGWSPTRSTWSRRWSRCPNCRSPAPSGGPGPICAPRPRPG